MPDLVQSLKAEIRRISRREIKSSVTPIRSSNVALKKTLAGLKKRIAVLEAENKRLLSLQESTQKQQQAAAPAKVRITAKSIRALRKKLGLSQADFGKLIGLSSQNILVMEHKQGRLRMFARTLSSILAIRGIGKKEAKKRLKEIEGRGKKVKK
jgi:DNA-binding transcriptional regulator YiaG